MSSLVGGGIGTGRWNAEHWRGTGTPSFGFFNFDQTQIQLREQGDAQAQSVSLVCSTGGTGGEEPRDVGVEVETRLPGIQRAADFPDCTLGLVRMKSYHERDSGRYCLAAVFNNTSTSSGSNDHAWSHRMPKELSGACVIDYINSEERGHRCGFLTQYRRLAEPVA